MYFATHPDFDRDLDKFLHKHHADKACLLRLQNVLTAHFEKRIILPPTILIPLETVRGHTLYKITMAVEGVRRNQSPRVALTLLVDNDSAIFLCFGTHIDNYTTLELTNRAKKRLKEMLDFQNNKDKPDINEIA